MNHNLDDIELPKDSRGEQLETISKNYFQPLFNVKKFILKEEIIDNGIDYRIEIKKNGKKLGFGLNFQLKSTESVTKNKDNSYSKSLETSNIEYLLNNGQPAFYGFYIEEEKAMYYENLETFIQSLNSKNPEWQKQQYHTLRFTKKLDQNSLNIIYDLALKKGLMLRTLNSKLAENSNNIKSDKKIIIDYEGNTKTDDEIEQFIEKYGLFLDTEYRWNEIIRIHNQSSRSSKKSQLYNLIIGFSYFHTGEYFKALEYLKKAYDEINLISDNLKGYLIYFYSELQIVYGLINREDYNSQLNNIPDNSDIKKQLTLQKIQKLAQKLYTSDSFTSPDYEEQIQALILENSDNPKVFLPAKIEHASYRSERLICQIMPSLLVGANEYIGSEYTSILDDYNSILLDCEKCNSLFISHLCSLRQNKFVIQVESIIRFTINEDLNYETLEKILKQTKLTYKYFCEIGHIENQLYALTVILELHQNMENEERVNEVISLMEDYILKFPNPELKKKIEFTKEGGTLINHLINQKENIKKIDEEIKSKREELIKLDSIEKEKNLSHSNYHIVELFPIGHFQVPKNKIKIFFEIVNISDEKLKIHIKKLLKMIIPVFNTYSLKINTEGYLKGNLEYKGIESYRNMYKIRKAFFENKFYRTKIF
ncbi:DUF4365 domain-containing protein [Polaribacter porphyrae]|uniref:DUF4365 domain-containing protein n=1 Tax=Polaribacter porphyrae TaxID=1137780 RepID=A0A2S7WPM7_9FLAO|nr:DUF4365 domain-containing protein [Polaribacter porphyrae]PQJ79557.1 hypothetical protein BTO18_10405 [Polaribacter porphyrae]